MKKLLITSVLSTFFYCTNAQISYGGKAGLNSFYKIHKYSSSTYSYKHGIGYYLGGFANKKINPQFALQLELLYLSERYKVLSNRYGYQVGLHPEDDSYSTTNSNFIHIPFLLQYNTKFGLYAETGPQLGLIVSAKEYNADTSVNTKKFYYNATALHWDFGIGYDLEKYVGGLKVNARYNYSISKGKPFGYIKRVFCFGFSYKLKNIKNK